MASSKKGISSHQMHRALGITYKSAWFLTHRIRDAMRGGSVLPPLGGSGKVLEVDETYIGRLQASRFAYAAQRTRTQFLPLSSDVALPAASISTMRPSPTSRRSFARTSAASQS